VPVAGARRAPEDRDRPQHRLLAQQGHRQHRAPAVALRHLAQPWAGGVPTLGLGQRLAREIAGEERRAREGRGAGRAFAERERDLRPRGGKASLGPHVQPLIVGIELEHRALLGAAEPDRGLGHGIENRRQIERGRQRGRDLTQRRELAGLGLGRAEQARILGHQGDLAGDGRG